MQNNHHVKRSSLSPARRWLAYSNHEKEEWLKGYRDSSIGVYNPPLHCADCFTGYDSGYDFGELQRTVEEAGAEDEGGGAHIPPSPEE